MEPKNNNDLSLDEVKKLLGVSSPDTVKNWLEGGHFPGAYLSEEGQWRFHRADVFEVKARIEELAEKNRHGDFSLSECETEPPLL
jgi:hypothetical protein